MFNCFFGHDWCFIFSIEDWEWHTPSTLTRDYPVTTVTNHVVKTNFTPLRMEFNFFNLIQNLLTEFRNRGKPLWHSTPDDWFLRTPVKWVWVWDFFFSKEQITEFFHNDWRHFIVELTFKIRTSIFHHDTTLINGYGNFKAISNTYVIVILTKTRSRMDDTCTWISSNVITKDNKLINFCIPWVFSDDLIQFFTTVWLKYFHICPAELLRKTIK